MTYSEFLESLVSPIFYFVNWLSTTAESLIHNYFFITMLGIVLFISLVWLVYDLINFKSFSSSKDLDNFNDRR